MALDERFVKQSKEFITAVLRARNPRLNTSSNSAIYDAFIAPGSIIQASIQQEIEHLRRTNSLSNFEDLTSEEMDKLAENLLTVGRLGGKEAVGTVQAYYPTAKRRTIATGTAARTQGGKEYQTKEDLSFREEDYLSRDGFFFINIPFTAKEVGEAGETGSHTITMATGLGEDLDHVDNDNAFVGGVVSETNSEFFEKLQREVSSRNVATSDGMVSVLRDFQGTLIETNSIGYGAPEMLRDEMYQNDVDGTFNVTKIGTATGIHIGGRVDQYSWFRRLAFIQKVVDKSDDYALANDHPLGLFTVTAQTTSATVGTALPTTGRLVLDFGKDEEETITYSGYISVAGGLRFDLTTSLIRAHTSGGPIRVVSNGRLSVDPDSGDIDVVPVLFIQKIETLDPITLEPFGDPIPETDTTLFTPSGWRFETIDNYTFLGARETKTLVLDEKSDVIHNVFLDFLGAVIDPADNTLTAPVGISLANRQGQVFTATRVADGSTQTRRVLRVEADTITILYDGAVLGADFTRITFPENFRRFVEFPIQVSYFTNLEHASIQTIFDSSSRRAIGEDYQSRNFLPVFLDFSINYRGSVISADMRSAVLDVLQPANILFSPILEGMQVEISDIVVALGNAGADFIELPFEIKAEEISATYSKTIRYFSPVQSTRAALYIQTAVVIGDRVIQARFDGTGYTPPSAGNLRLGGPGANKEVRSYVAFSTAASVEEDQVFNFILTTAVAFAHPITESLLVTKSDYDPALEITNGVISSDNAHRPYIRNITFINLDE